MKTVKLANLEDQGTCANNKNSKGATAAAAVTAAVAR
jgi:hypothetical protein